MKMEIFGMEILSSDFFGIIVFITTLSMIGIVFYLIWRNRNFIDEDYEKHEEDYEKPKKQTYEEYVDERLRIEKKIHRGLQ